jgi:hypothetical protein
VLATPLAMPASVDLTYSYKNNFSKLNYVCGNRLECFILENISLRGMAESPPMVRYTTFLLTMPLAVDEYISARYL